MLKRKIDDFGQCLAEMMNNASSSVIDVPQSTAEPPEKAKRGRPLGSKNKKRASARRTGVEGDERNAARTVAVSPSESSAGSIRACMAWGYSGTLAREGCPTAATCLLCCTAGLH